MQGPAGFAILSAGVSLSGGAGLRPVLMLNVEGGTLHVIPLERLESLQSVMDEFGAEAFPLFLRLGGPKHGGLQPVTARALLAEIEKVIPRLGDVRIPGILFRGADGAELGSAYAKPGGRPLAGIDGMALYVTPQGIRVTTTEIPPPAGFRSGPEMPAGEYECFFSRIAKQATGWIGDRTLRMRGSGAPVPLLRLPLPPVTRWDHARTAGTPAVAALELVETPAADVYRDPLHALISACTEALRLKRPLQFRVD